MHGGAPFSSDDPTMVAICRQMAKSTVKNVFSTSCLLPLSYALGTAKALLRRDGWNSAEGLTADDVPNVRSPTGSRCRVARAQQANVSGGSGGTATSDLNTIRQKGG